MSSTFFPLQPEFKSSNQTIDRTLQHLKSVCSTREYQEQILYQATLQSRSEAPAQTSEGQSNI